MLRSQRLLPSGRWCRPFRFPQWRTGGGTVRVHIGDAPVGDRFHKGNGQQEGTVRGKGIRRVEVILAGERELVAALPETYE